MGLHHTQQYVSDALRGYPVVNSYGLFARMTTERFELVLEGSQDGSTWQAFEFRYKPNETNDLSFAGLHMPRLDWQMWFAALYPNCSRRWLFGLVDALLDDSSDVNQLLLNNPFDERPPQFIRIRRMRATFTDERRGQRHDEYWHFEMQTKPYCPVLNKAQLERAKVTRQH